MAQIQASSLDFIKNEIQNVSLQKLAAAPVSPVLGQIYYNTTDNRVYVCTNIVGPVWLALDAEDAPSETDTTLGTIVAAATEKTTPIDADLIPIVDSAASNVLKKLTWANLKARLGALYAALSHNHNASDINAGTLPLVRGGTGATTLSELRATMGIINGECTTAGSVQVKVITFATPIVLVPGALFAINFTNTNTVAAPVFQINSVSYDTMMATGGIISDKDLPAAGPYIFVYYTTPIEAFYLLTPKPRGETVYTMSTLLQEASFRATALDADLLPITDSANSHILKKFTWAQFKSAIATGLASTFAAYSHVGAGGAAHADVIAGGADGFMTGADKTKLDGIANNANNYTHPANHPASIITQDASNRFVTDAEKSTWNGKEPSITTDLVTKFWSGTKTWRDLATDVRAVVLTGLSTATNAVITATDSILVALGKLQAQITEHRGNTSNPHSVTKTQLNLGNVDNTSDANKPVSTAQQTALDLKAPLASPALTGTPTAPTAAVGTNSTQLATTAFVGAEIASKLATADAMIFKGSVGASGTLEIAAFNALVVYDAGWTYKVITAGTIKGKVCEVGDMLVATVDRTSGGVDADWIVLQTNVDGAVTGPASSTDGYLVLWNGTTGKVIKNSTINPANLVQGPASAADGNIPLYDGTTGKLLKNSTYSPASFAPAVHNHDTVYVKKAFTQAIGGATSVVVTHNLNTRALVIGLYQSASPYAEVSTAIERTSLNTVTVYFGTAPAAGEYTIVIMG